MLRVVIMSTIVSVGGGLFLVPRAGQLGAALVVGGIDLSGWLVSLPYYRRVVGSLQLQAWWRPALGAACVIGCSYVLRLLGLPVLLRLPLSGLAYIPFVFGELWSYLA